jgi:cytochrome P450
MTTAPELSRVADDDLTYDIFDPAYIDDPFPVWDRLRSQCPVAHSAQWGGSWMVTRHDDVVEVARDTAQFSSSSVTVLPRPEQAAVALPGGSPPITCDPPTHTEARRPLSSWFSPRRAAQLEPFTQDLCQRLLDDIVGRGSCDAAADYARRIPIAVIGSVLGVARDEQDAFADLVHDVFTSPEDERRVAAITAIVDYFTEQIAVRRETPGPDLISGLLHGHEPAMSTGQLLGTASLLLAAGIDTASSVLGSALWHLATHDDDRRRLGAEPELIPGAVEEFLRAYAPSTMGRIVTSDVEFRGRQLRRGERMLLNFPAANRDEEAFVDAATVVIDRQPNRHLAFGVGIHRCVGAHLARMELRVALREWLRVIPEFRLDPAAAVVWSGGQVRGPRSLRLVLT